MDSAVSAAENSGSPRPLCVDLDGTLVKSDTLLDGLCHLVRRNPLGVFRIPLWIAGGRARLKLEVARRAPLQVARLPYNAELLRYLQEQRRNGREMYLATGADGALAEQVAAHLGVFKGVLATSLKTNLTSTRKLERLQQTIGAFDYIGNSWADVPLLAKAGVAMVANPTLALRLAIRLKRIPIARVFTDRISTGRVLLKALRVHQWAKNILLILPLLLSHKITPAGLLAVLKAFFCFSFIASVNYLINDMLDIEADRRHPSKRLRPFAAGDLSVGGALILAFLLMLAAIAILPTLPHAFILWLGLYIVAASAYTAQLKRIAVVDVLLLSGLYTLRLLAGGAATATPISQWLASFSSFLFLSLAMVKRFSELENLRERGATAIHGRGYLVADLEQIRSFGTASAYAAVVVFMLYIARPDVSELYHHPTRLWLIVPLLLYWLHRVWLLASRGDLNEDPVVFAMRDRMSLLTGAGVLALAIFAA